MRLWPKRSVYSFPKPLEAIGAYKSNTGIIKQNTAAKKQAAQGDTDLDYLFADCSQRAVSRFGCGKSSVIKQTLEMQGDDTSATRDPLKEACLVRDV